MGRRHLSEVDLTEYADGETAPEKVGAAEEHLGRCEVCAEALASVRGSVSAVSSLRSVAAPADLRSRVFARLAAGSRGEATCQQMIPQLHKHLDGCLSAVAASALEQHLSVCTRCRSDLAAFSAAKELVGSLPNVESPARVREVVEAARRLRPLGAPRWVRWRPAFAAAAAVALGLVLLRFGLEQGSAPEMTRVPRELATPVAQPFEVAVREESTSAPAAVEAERDDMERASATEAAPVVIAEAETERGAAPVPTRVVRLPTGPTPAPTTPEAPEPEVVLPSAVRTLRAVASSVSYDREAQMAMELVGERFTTLDSEKMLARLPIPPNPVGGEDSDAGEDVPVLSPRPEEQPEVSYDQPRSPAWGPMGGRANSSPMPLV